MYYGWHYLWMAGGKNFAVMPSCSVGDGKESGRDGHAVI